MILSNVHLVLFETDEKKVCIKNSNDNPEGSPPPSQRSAGVQTELNKSNVRAFNSKINSLQPDKAGGPEGAIRLTPTEKQGIKRQLWELQRLHK